MRSELKAESNAVIEEQRLRVRKLGEELQESEREKTRLEQSVKEQFERAKVCCVEYLVTFADLSSSVTDACIDLYPIETVCIGSRRNVIVQQFDGEMFI